MNILERQQMMLSHVSMTRIGGKRNETSEKLESPEEFLQRAMRYWDMLQKPNVRQYLPDFVWQTLYNYTTSAKLMNNPPKLFQLMNELLAPYCFKPLSSGTNRRAFYYELDPTIILKVGFDRVGRQANINEFFFQNYIKPYCPKIFSITPEGMAILSERVETMSKQDYDRWFLQIFNFIHYLLEQQLVMDDVGSNFFKNYGIRLGFGPVILDFAEIYRIDYRRLKCIHPDPMTGEICNGNIDYDYDNFMNQIICKKCGTRYSAKYIAEQVPPEALSTIITRKELNRHTLYPVTIVKGDGEVVRVFEPETPRMLSADDLN